VFVEQVLDIIDDYARERGWFYNRIDGSIGRAKRTFLIDRFNAKGSQDFIFLMSTRAGGMGINLQTADTCILFDSDWNPQPDLQAMARVHRIGQTKTVHVYRLVANGTAEERIVQRAQRKLYLDQMVNRKKNGEDVEVEQEAEDDEGVSVEGGRGEGGGGDVSVMIYIERLLCERSEDHSRAVKSDRRTSHRLFPLFAPCLWHNSAVQRDLRTDYYYATGWTGDQRHTDNPRARKGRQ